jgi:sirohydrochlorin ferrochelatase
MKTALIVMVHGSPRPIANADMFRVVDVVRASGRFDIVEAGFMECNEPSIADAIEDVIRRGAARVIAVPYFLHTGTHVADDLPGILDDAKVRHPEVEFAMGRYIGTSTLLTDILAERARVVA